MDKPILKAAREVKPAPAREGSRTARPDESEVIAHILNALSDPDHSWRRTPIPR